MKARGDERIDRAIEKAVGTRPLDALEIRDALVRDHEGVIAGREGLLHAAILRMVRRGALWVDGTSEHGLARYAPMSTDHAAVPPSLRKLDPQDPEVHVARRLAKAVKVPATRERITADVAAHRRALRNAAALGGFGSERAFRYLLHRVDRGRTAVLFPEGAGDIVRRLVLHEGPWIVGAVVAFLLIRAFVAEVFVIPSGSMEPTLDIGDRVVVLKPGGRDRPERWSIVTFTRGDITYVKRAIALGGERVALVGGDVFINGQLAVKPPRLRAELRRPYARWTFANPVAAPAGWTVQAGIHATDGEEGEVPEELWTYQGAPLWSSGRRPDGGPEAGGDVPLRDAYAELVASRETGAVVALGLVYRPMDPDGLPTGPVETRYSLEVGDDGARLEIFDGAKTVWIARASIRPAHPVVLRLAFVDGVLTASTGSASWERPLPPEQQPPLGMIVGPRARLRAAAHLQSLSLDADLHYTNVGQLGVAPSLDEAAELQHGWPVPAGRVFFLGDNTTNSRDSRWSEVGAIPQEQLIGPVRFRIWPLSRIGRVP